MRKVSLLALIFLVSTSFAQTQYFPKLSLDKHADLDRMFRDWYSVQLTALHEPSLLGLANKPFTESYRFLWLRTFHHPMAVRLDVREDGTSVLTTKIGSGAGGYRPGVLIENKERKLSTEQAQTFLLALQRTDFWHITNPVTEPTGNDGSRWVIEGVKNGQYHIVDRWSPKNGPVYELGRLLAFDLAHVDVPVKEIY